MYKRTVTYYTYWDIYCVAQTVHAENTGNGNDHVCSKSFWASYLKCTSGQFQYFENIKDTIPSNKSLGHYKLLHRTLFQPGHPSRWGVYKLNCLERLPQFSPGAPELDAWLVSDKEVTQRSKQFKVSVHSLNPTKKLVLQRLRAISKKKSQFGTSPFVVFCCCFFPIGPSLPSAMWFCQTTSACAMF